MLKNRWLVLVIISFCYTQLMHSELLIIVKDKITNNFRTMTHEETVQYQSKISDILLKYQWPMCIQSDLTPAEITEYLAPNKPYAQEQFIQKKLQEIINPSEIDLNVMFVPTSFYELYCIAEQSYNAFHKQYEQALKSGNMHVAQLYFSSERRNDLLNSDIEQARVDLKQSFSNVNQLFFKSTQDESASSSINNKLAQYIFNAYPELCEKKSVLDLSNTLESKLDALKAIICETLAQDDTYKKTITSNGISRDTSEWFKEEPQTRIISTVMKIEYEARSLNKALILRGTDILEEAISFKHAKHEQDLILAGSTVHEARSFKHSLLGTQEKPYSISYANSLFAGFYQDPGGCAYTYLNGRKSNLENRDVIGYGLLIDQKSYMQDGNKGLFYIPSLAPLTSLFERGQYCHPRSRVAVPDKLKVNKIEGLLRTNKEGLIDPADIIVFQGDPIKHEQKFSTFLAENGRLIHANPEDIEQNSESKIIASHKKVAKLHQQVQVLGKKTLRRLMRAGSQTIPGFSEIELNDMLENGATTVEYTKLQKALSTLQLEPITKQILQMSNNDLYKAIVLNRFKVFLDEVLNSLLKGDVVKGSTNQIIKICEKEPSLKADNVDVILKIIEKSLNNENADEQLVGLKFVQSFVSSNLIKVDNVEVILKILENSLNSKSSDMQLARWKVLDSCISNNLIKAGNVDVILKIIKSNLNSEDEKVSIRALNLVSDFLQQNLVTAGKVNLVLKAIESSLNSENNDVKYRALELVDLIAEKNLVSGSAKDQIEQALKDTHKGSLVERRNAIVKIQEYVASLKAPQVNVPRTSMLDATKKSVFSSTRSNLMRFKIPNELSKGDDATAYSAVPSEKDLNNQRAQLEKFQQMMDVRNSLPQTTGIRGKVYDGSSLEYARQLSEYGRQVPVVKNPFMDPTKIALAARRSVARALAK